MQVSSVQPKEPVKQNMLGREAFDICEVQAVRLQPGNSAAAHDEPMETEHISSGPLSNTQDMSFPSTQDSERIYERCSFRRMSLQRQGRQYTIRWTDLLLSGACTAIKEICCAGSM